MHCIKCWHSFSANTKLHLSWLSTVSLTAMFILWSRLYFKKKNWQFLSCFKNSPSFWEQKLHYWFLTSSPLTRVLARWIQSKITRVNLSEYCLTLSPPYRRVILEEGVLRVPPISTSFTWYHFSSWRNLHIFEILVIKFTSVCYYLLCLRFRSFPQHSVLRHTKLPLYRLIFNNFLCQNKYTGWFIQNAHVVEEMKVMISVDALANCSWTLPPWIGIASEASYICLLSFAQ